MRTLLANLTNVFIHNRVTSIRIETDDEFVQFIRFCFVCLLGLLFQKKIVECAMFAREKTRVRNERLTLHTFPNNFHSKDEVTAVLVLV